MTLLSQVTSICRSRGFFVVRGQGHSSKLCATVMKCLFSVRVYIFLFCLGTFKYTQRQSNVKNETRNCIINAMNRNKSCQINSRKQSGWLQPSSCHCEPLIQFRASNCNFFDGLNKGGKFLVHSCKKSNLAVLIIQQ